MQLSFGDIAAATRGRILSGDPTRCPSGVSIDSRTLARGEAFFAIVGKIHDAHDHVDEAVARGCSGAVVSRAAVASRLAATGVPVVVVEDTTRALQDVAGWVRRRDGVTVAAITGSAGKTTTKELAALLIAGDRPTHASPGNLNNQYGLPLTLLRMPPETRACVLELGISTPHEMQRLVEISSPDIGLVTIIGTAHLGNFRSFSELAEEKMKLARGSRRALLNVDDAAQAERRGSVLVPVTPYGEGEAAAAGVRLLEIAPLPPVGSHLTIAHAGGTFQVPCPLPGRHQARNMLAAVATALAMGVPAEVISRRAVLAKPSPHRGEVVEVGGALLIDDCYNANPVAMVAALDLLAEVAGSRRRMVVTGDMLELGETSGAEHRKLGEAAARRGVAALLGVGPASRLTVEAARAAGALAEHVEDAESAGRWMHAHLAAGDVVLVKGSRGIGLDRAIAELRRLRGEGGAA